MGLFSKKAPVEEQVAAEPTGSSHYDEKTTGEHPGDRSSDDEPISKDLQAGVAKVEAMTTVWTKRDLIIAYTL